MFGGWEWVVCLCCCAPIIHIPQNRYISSSIHAIIHVPHHPSTPSSMHSSSTPITLPLRHLSIPSTNHPITHAPHHPPPHHPFPHHPAPHFSCTSIFNAIITHPPHHPVISMSLCSWILAFMIAQNMASGHLPLGRCPSS